MTAIRRWLRHHRAQLASLAFLAVALLIAACGASSSPTNVSTIPTPTSVAISGTPTGTPAIQPTSVPTATPPQQLTPTPVPATPVPTQVPPTATPTPNFPTQIPTHISGSPTPVPTHTPVPTATTKALTPTPGPTHTPLAPTPTTKTPTATAGPTSYEYLYSRVDYPLEIPVNGHDTVTLLLSTNAGILSVTPVAGQGNGQAVAPIPLPTDLAGYKDVGAIADTASDGTSPVVWQLTGAPRQSLLSCTTNLNCYHNVTFTWNVHAVDAGQNRVKITLGIYYIYRSGQEEDGTVELTASPIPMVAVASTPLDDVLRRFKVPAASLAGIGAFFGVLRFFYGLFEKVSTVTGTVKDAAGAAREAKKVLNRHNPPADQPPPTLVRPRRPTP